MKALLEVLVRHNRLNSEKRLKLMCTPLKSLQAKTVEIATNKFHAWWYVVCNVQENLSVEGNIYISMVFEPFLHFCFGPLFPTPELQLEPNETATQVKRFVHWNRNKCFSISSKIAHISTHLTLIPLQITAFRTFHSWQSQRCCAFSMKATNKSMSCSPNFHSIIQNLRF